MCGSFPAFFLLATRVTSCYVIPLPLFQLSSCPDLFVLLLVRYLSQGFSRSSSVHLLFLLLPCFFLSFFFFFSLSLFLSVSFVYIPHPPIAFLSVFCPTMHTILRFFCTNVPLLLIPPSLFLVFDAFVLFLFLSPCGRCN